MRRLEDRELTRLIHVIPGLADPWARTAKTTAEVLLSGSKRGRAALRTALVHRADELAGILAVEGYYGLVIAITETEGIDIEHREALTTLDSADVPTSESDTDHQTSLWAIAAEAGRRLGPNAATALLTAIAASPRIPAAPIAAENLGALTECASQAWEPVLGEELVDPDVTVADSAGFTSTAETLSLERLLEENARLSSESTSLLTDAERMAAAVRQGVAFDVSGASFDRWSAAVRAHLQEVSSHFDVTDLASAEIGLKAKIAEHGAAVASQRQQAEAVRALLKLGLEDQAGVLAAAHGYKSATALLAAVEAATEPEELDEHIDLGRSDNSVQQESLPTMAGHDSADDSPQIPTAIEPDGPNAVTGGTLPTVVATDPAVGDTASAPEEATTPVDASTQEAGRSTSVIAEGQVPTPANDRGTLDAGATGGSVAGEPLEAEPADQQAAGRHAQEGQREASTEDAGDALATEAISIHPNPLDVSSVREVPDSMPGVPAPVDPVVGTFGPKSPVRSASGSDIPDFPWDDGDPPLIAQLVDDGREATAVHVAQAKGESPGRVRLLRLLTAVNHCSAGQIQRLLPELIPSEEESGGFGQDEYQVYVSAVARASVKVGYPPLSIEQLTQHAAIAGSPLGDLMAALAAIARAGQRYAPSPLAGVDHDDRDNAWSEAAARASELLGGMRASTIKYHRATRVLHHLCRAEELLGRALLTVEALAQRSGDPEAQEWSVVADSVRVLADRSAWDRLIDDADARVSTKTQLRKPIEFGARDKLHDQLRRVSELLVDFLNIRDQLRTNAPYDDQQADTIQRALAAIGDITPLKTVGDAAVRRLLRWLHHGETGVREAETLDDLLSNALVAATGLPRDEHQHPTRNLKPDELSAVIDPPDPATVVRGYLAAGNFARATDLMRQWEPDGLEEWDDEFRRARNTSREHHRRLVERVERAANRLRALTPDAAPSDFEAPLESVRAPNPDRYDLAAASLLDLAVSAEGHLSRSREVLRARIASAPITDEQRDRIDSLLDSDEALAAHFLTLAEFGEELPPPEAERDEDFQSFFPGAVRAAADANSDRIEAVQAHLRGDCQHAPSQNERLQRGVRAWRSLSSSGPSSPQVRENLPDILGMIGLVRKPTNWLRDVQTTFRAGYAVYRLQAEPVDTGFVAEIGSLAKGSYELTLVWDTVSPTRMLEFVPEARRSSANIVLYLGVLGTTQRTDLRRLTREQNFSPVVIDTAVIGWLSTREEPSWRITQKITLPFTAFNPYTPYAGGEVPPEVFVGRTAERRAVTNPVGPWFVYGGRQLGKSALLRRVEKDFTEPSDPDAKLRAGHVALYMDLKVAGLQRPDELWRLLGERLRDAKVLPPTTASRKDAVSAQLTDWFRADERNRLLLLLDEADKFLVADADSPGDRDPFQALEGLKQIVLSTDRRFKPVFAGLHMVQRFHSIPNTAVVHGGREILIGPLDSVSARRLVVKPLGALGYSFESPELVWRLLIFSNYIASFVQIVCESLVRYLASRPLPAGGGAAVITAADVDHVCNDPAVRAQLAERFRWTIRLDNRYLVIALVAALRSLESPTPAAFVDVDLREECEAFWPEAFGSSTLTVREFQTYLEELVGLGVLRRVRTDGEPRYGLRNANLVTMLGTPEQLNRELYEASKDLELNQDYNPAVNRALMEKSPSLSARRSPLSDEDVGRILDRRDRADYVMVIVGSAALGISDVGKALIQASRLRENAIGVHVVGLEDVAERLEVAPTKPIHMIVDISADRMEPDILDAPDIRRLRERVSQWQRLSATIVLAPRYLPLPSWVAPTDVISLRRWSIAGLQAWRDSPFSTPELRADLHRVTSGWPRLIEQAMGMFESGTQTSDVIKKLRAVPESREAAQQFLTDVGLDTKIAQTWSTWFINQGADLLLESTVVPTADLSEALGTDALPVLERLERLDLVDQAEAGWVLDRVVASAMRTLFPQ